MILIYQTGHWYGDKREFNFLTVYNTTKMFDYIHSRYNGLNEDLDALKSMAVTSGHAELIAQAYYLGFSMWKDLTYPLMSQLLLTNGQDFSFAYYQLNTLKLWNKAAPHSNLCHITIPERLFELNDTMTEVKLNENVFKRILNTLVNKPVSNDTELVENYSELDYMIGGSRLRPYLSVNDFEKQLSIRRKLFAISLYELVKYDRPASYLNLRSETDPVTSRPQFAWLYDKLTYEFRDIVLDHYPRDYYGFKLIERILLRKAPKQTDKFWDLKQPVYEWATVPPPDTNNIKRNIDLTKF